MSLGLSSLLIFANLSFAQNGSSNGSQNNTSGQNHDIGYLSIEADIDSFFVVLDNNFKQAVQVSNNDTLAVATGWHSVRVIKKYYKDSIFKTEIEKDNVSRVRTNLLAITNPEQPSKKLSSYPRLVWEAPLIIKTDLEAVIYVNGNYAGTGIGSANVVGPIEIRSELPTGEFTTKVVNLNKSSQAFYLEELYNRPEKRTARRRALLPGASQIYKKEYFKGYALLGTTVLSTAIAIKKHFDYKKYYDGYLSLSAAFDDYRKKGDTRKPEEIFPPVRDLKDKADLSAKVRNISIVVALGAYFYSFIDGWIEPEYGWRKTIEIDPYFDFDHNYLQKAGLSAQYNF